MKVLSKGMPILAIVISLLMVSSSTAVPNVNSNPLMNIINEIEKNQKIIEKKLATKPLDLESIESSNILINKIKDTILDVTHDTKEGGFIINLLIKIIEWLISIVQDLISIVYKLIDLVEIITTLVDIIDTLFNLIRELIDKIMDIFTPGALKST